MKTWQAVTIGVVVVGLILVGTLATSVMSFYNNSIQMENGIKAQYAENKNNYDNYFKKVKEIVQVPSMYIADLQKVWGDVMTNRYGKGGAKAFFSWIKEHNPEVDSSLYKRIQDVIEAGRNSFEADQKMLIDKRREYDNYRNVFPNNLMAGAFHFPRIDLKEFDIVTSGETEAAFTTKKSDPISLR